MAGAARRAGLHDLSFSPHVRLLLDLPPETLVQACFPVPSAGQIRWQHGASPYTDDFWYAGLPTKNSDFGGGHTPGYHLATMTVNGNLSQQAGFQLFFTGVDSNGNYVANYPTASTNKAPDGSVIPNWYYYYNQASSASGKYETNTQTEPSSHIDLTSPFSPHLHNDAYKGGRDTFPVFTVDTNAASPTYNLVHVAGTMKLIGIHSYAWISAHEQGHQILSALTDANGNYLVYNWPLSGSGPATSDGDHVSDDWEVHHHFNPYVADTTGQYSGAGEPGDDEAIADIAGLAGLLSNKALWKQDWADGGTQINKPPIASPNGDLTQPVDFYWTFIASVSGKKQSGQVFNIGDTWNVWSISDLPSGAITSVDSLYTATPYYPPH